MLVEVAIFVYPMFDNLYNNILTWNFPVMDQEMTGIQYQHELSRCLMQKSIKKKECGNISVLKCGWS